MKLYTTKEAADFLKVNIRTIQNYRKAGILIPDQFGANNSVLNLTYWMRDAGCA